jgi:type IV pilus biogenesis protein PilP
VIATPVDPPAPDATFDFNANGLVVATPQGAVTPDGILVIAGTPPLNPPTRPGTVAPEITPQDQIAAVVPETAQPVADAPEGVIVIAGRPSIEPPVRTGTVVPQAAPMTGNTLVATDGLVVFAGSPTVLPPARPATVATPVAVTSEAVLPVTSDSPPENDSAPVEIEPEGINLIAGPPPVLPPARPGTLAPQNDAGLTDLTTDIAAARATTTAQAPGANVLRPLVRPAAEVQAAAAVQTPTLETAAAVQATADRPNPIVNPTAQAVAQSERPDSRPRNMARILARATAANERAAGQVASVAPSGPTGSAVAQNATLENAMNLRDVNLIGIYGSSNDRRALVRLGNGRYVRLTVGDQLDGGRVTAISAGALSYTKRGRAITLEVAD